MYEYRATIIRHIDADTSHVEIDLGFDQSVKKTIRWAGIDAPERWTESGKIATAAISQMLPVGTSCTLKTIKDRKEKYGRYLGVFIREDGTNLDEWLAKQGHVVIYGEDDANT